MELIANFGSFLGSLWTRGILYLIELKKVALTETSVTGTDNNIHIHKLEHMYWKYILLLIEESYYNLLLGVK